MLVNLLRTANFSLLRSTFRIKQMQRCLSDHQPASSSASPSVTVPGLSSAVLKIPDGEEVGPGATKSGQYKNPEYFCYNPTSYFEAEIEILKYRCPQPSSKVNK